jgi:hypothetical protein
MVFFKCGKVAMAYGSKNTIIGDCLKGGRVEML